jgi:uncharacterized protein (TIGR02569 family)
MSLPLPTSPSHDVLAAFGATADPEPLQGGRGGTWRAGDLVLKPVDFEPESRWRAMVLDKVSDTDAFRVARPVCAASGDWLFQGWEASRLVAGRTDPTRWDEAIASGSAFHEAIAEEARPAFLDERDDWWSRADRASWDLEQPIEEAPVLRELVKCRVPVQVECQAVHGDLLGNVLYEPGLPPAVIDWAPYWRPVAWAAAVAAVDAMCWHGAGEAVLDRAGRFEEWTQMAVRALLFRMITDREASHAKGNEWEPHPAYQPVASAIIRRASDGR